MVLYTILSVKSGHGKLNELLNSIKGISNANLFTVSVDQISVVVSDIKRADLITDRTNAIAYAGVVEILAQQFTLLPVRFGSMMESADAVIKMLEKNYQELQQNLEKVENKFEFGLKIFCDSEKLKASLILKSEVGASTNINKIQEIKNTVFRDYVNKKLAAHRLEELLISHVDSVIAVIKGHLAQLNTISKFKKMLTETTIVDAVLLLDKERKDPLINVIEGLQKHYPGLNFVLTGPWPPYNFVDFTIK